MNVIRIPDIARNERGFDRIILGIGFNETVIDPFLCVGGCASNPTTILEKGAVLQAKLLAYEDLLPAFRTDTELTKVQATSKTIGLIFPEEGAEESSLGSQQIPVVLKETTSARRIHTFNMDLEENNSGSKCGR